ncbi:PAS-domain containing protein, partial [Acinetobacter baumannii]
AARLRNILLDAVIAKRDVELLATRFDTALNNMPHGLAMFDATGRLVVVNARWGEMLHCDPGSIRSGARVDAIVAGYVESGVINPHDAS